jgi:MFS family permease
VAYGLWFFANDFTVFLVSRIIAGIMTGNVSTANAVVADITTTDNRARGMAVIGMAFGFGFILGPAIGGLSYHYLPRCDAVPWLAALGANPFSVPALIALLLGLVNLAWVAWRLPETLPHDRLSETGTGRTINPLKLFSASRGAVLVTINWSTFLHALLFAGLETTMVFLAAQRLGFGPHHNGLLFAWMGLLAALVQGVVFRRMAPRVGQRILGIVGFAFLAPGFLVVGLVDWWPHAWVLVVGVTILTLGTGLVFPALNTLASLAAPAANQGWALGGFRSANALGRALGPLLAAMVYFWLSPAAPFLLGAIGFLLPLWLLARLRMA